MFSTLSWFFHSHIPASRSKPTVVVIVSFASFSSLLIVLPKFTPILVLLPTVSTAKTITSEKTKLNSPVTFVSPSLIFHFQMCSMSTFSDFSISGPGLPTDPTAFSYSTTPVPDKHNDWSTVVKTKTKWTWNQCCWDNQPLSSPFTTKPLIFPTLNPSHLAKPVQYTLYDLLSSDVTPLLPQNAQEKIHKPTFIGWSVGDNGDYQGIYSYNSYWYISN